MIMAGIDNIRRLWHGKAPRRWHAIVRSLYFSQKEVTQIDIAIVTCMAQILISLLRITGLFSASTLQPGCLHRLLRGHRQSVTDFAMDCYLSGQLKIEKIHRLKNAVNTHVKSGHRPINTPGKIRSAVKKYARMQPVHARTSRLHRLNACCMKMCCRLHACCMYPQSEQGIKAKLVKKKYLNN